MIVVGYPDVSSTFAGRVSQVIAKRRLDTEPPAAPTDPEIVVGDDPEPDPVPPPPVPLVPVPEPGSEHVVPAEQPLGGAWHLLVVRSQYHPP
jgi:hypothetical protein